MVREDLIDGAVTFLQDPSVASSPLEQKIAFLRSKNLTQEEIDVSLARVGQPSSPQSSPQNYSQPYQQQSLQRYGGYQQPPYWGQPPPEPPRRDWRDWFIMATVVSGASYAMYWTAKRYIYPLIAPPTPPQIEKDKASVDASFDKAFALLDQLATDTQELKESEKARKERLDSALSEVESVITRMKEANEAREMEAKRVAKELSEIREQIPQAMQREKDAMDERLKELAGEMKSLKTLVGNRLGQPQRTTPSSFTAPASNGINGVSSTTTAAAVPEPDAVNGSHDESEKLPSVLPDRSASSSPYGRMLGSGKAQIPAWQLAAKKKSDEAKRDSSSVPGISESGTMTESEVGA